MKKQLSIISAAALLLAGCGSSAAAASPAGSASSASSSEKDHLARIKESGKLVIGLEGDWQPFSYHDDSDQLVGFDVDVAAGIADYLGVKPSYTEEKWSGLFTGLSSGVYDIVANGVDVTDERKETYDFSDPYAYDHTVLVVRADNEDIKSFDDLKGRTTANSIGSTYMEIGESYGAEVSGVESLAACMSMVANGQVDATINAETSVQDYLKTTGDTSLKIVARSDDATEYAIPLVKGDDNATLLAAINEAIAHMREDGDLSKASETYFGADLTSAD